MRQESFSLKEMKANQHLYLVFGGYLKEIGKEDFSDIKSLEYVGIYDSFTKARKSLEI